VFVVVNAAWRVHEDNDGVDGPAGQTTAGVAIALVTGIRTVHTRNINPAGIPTHA
jgi:hypothetical protein